MDFNLRKFRAIGPVPCGTLCCSKEKGRDFYHSAGAEADKVNFGFGPGAATGRCDRGN